MKMKMNGFNLLTTVGLTGKPLKSKVKYVVHGTRGVTIVKLEILYIGQAESKNQ